MLRDNNLDRKVVDRCHCKVLQLPKGWRAAELTPCFWCQMLLGWGKFRAEVDQVDLSAPACRCFLYAQAVSQILKGLVTATASHLTRTAKQRNISFAHQSVAAIGANRQADGLPAARNIPSYADSQWAARDHQASLLGEISAGGNSSGQQQQSGTGSTIK